MKRVTTIGLAYITALVLLGCLPSLHPLYTDNTVVFDEQLIGKWCGQDGAIWSFTDLGENKYELRITDKNGKAAVFEVRLVQLGEYRFLDLYPGNSMVLDEVGDQYGQNLIAAHTFMKIDRMESELRLQWVNFSDVIKEDPGVLKHEQLENDTIVITAKSEDLQQALLQNLDKVIVDDSGKETFRRCPVLFSGRDVLYNSRLVGHWESAESHVALDITDGKIGYDLQIRFESNNPYAMHALLYAFGNYSIVGFFSAPFSEEDIEAGLCIIPDRLMLVEQFEPELKLRPVEWEEIIKTSLMEAVDMSFYTSTESVITFEK